MTGGGNRKALFNKKVKYGEMLPDLWTENPHKFFAAYPPTTIIINLETGYSTITYKTSELSTATSLITAFSD